jgi:polyhydroxyalkanoate synthesis repressor PhaR
MLMSRLYKGYTIMQMEKNGITIHYKKYSNRRLYDTQTKRYVTLQDISTTIKEGNTVVVTDKENNKDITSQVLTQIVLQQYQHLFSSELLHQLIKLPQYYIQEYVNGFLKSGVEAYVEYSNALTEQFNNWLNIGLPINNEKAETILLEFTKQFLQSFFKHIP